jgi:type VI protein secretion system component VasF
MLRFVAEGAAAAAMREELLAAATAFEAAIAAAEVSPESVAWRARSACMRALLSVMAHVCM